MLIWSGLHISDHPLTIFNVIWPPDKLIFTPGNPLSKWDSLYPMNYAHSLILLWLPCINVRFMSMAYCKSALTPVLKHWSYCSLALSHQSDPFYHIVQGCFFHTETMIWLLQYQWSNPEGYQWSWLLLTTKKKNIYAICIVHGDMLFTTRNKADEWFCETNENEWANQVMNLKYFIWSLYQFLQHYTDIE